LGGWRRRGRRVREVERKQELPSAADELESVVNDMLSGATLAGTSKVAAAAQALGIEPGSLQIAGAQRNIEAKFAEAIAPIKEALEGKTNPTREDVAKMLKANKLLDKLIEINEGRTCSETEDFRRSDGGVSACALGGGRRLPDVSEEHKSDLKVLLEGQRKRLLAEVKECGMDYEKAFETLRGATETVGAMVLRETLESYVDKLRELLLAKTKEEGRGHFGSLEANRAFADALSLSMESLGVRILGPRGPATLMIVKFKNRRDAGYFKFSTQETFSDLPAMKFVPTPIRGRPGPRRRSENAGR
jgi:hypothetical protein